MMHLDFRDARPLYSQIADGFRAQISAGILEPDQKLPSVRELAAELSINPNTIQRAYRELENENFIVTIPGKGCFVKAGPSDKSQLWQAFDQAAAQLLEAGVSRQQLLEHLIQGGSYHAPIK